MAVARPTGIMRHEKPALANPPTTRAASLSTEVSTFDGIVITINIRAGKA